MQFGMLGGSFDPVHYGHLYCAQVALKKLKLKKVFFVPAFISPFKIRCNDGAIPDIRLRMLELILKPEYEIIKFEINKKSVSYSIDTIKYIYDKYNVTIEKPFLIIGSDNLNVFDKWYKYRELLDMVELAVVERDGFPVSASPVKKIVNLGKSKYNISSSEIRKLINDKKDVSEFVPRIVMDFIKNEKLYQ